MGNDEIVQDLKSRFPDDVIAVEDFRGQASITISKNNILSICARLKTESGMHFDHLRDLCGVDYLDKKTPRFEVVYNLFSNINGIKLRLKAQVGEKDCAIDSVTSIWKTANWFERECFDMFGILFNGHPDLRRILLPEDWQGHPLRKDYPITGPGPDEEWEGFKEVLKKAEDYKEFQWKG